MIKIILFDFDGVIADSNNVKTEGFVKLFDGYPGAVKDYIKKFHLQNGGMSRFDKFRHIYLNILKEELPDKKFQQLCTDFNRLVLDGVIQAPMFEGVEDFLRRNKGIYDMYIVSGTPQDEIRMIVKRRGLDRYFLGVYGSPSLKKDLIDGIVSRNKYLKEEVVFLGDSINDYQGAVSSGIEFVGKVSSSLKEDLFPGVDLKVRVKDIKQFEEYLNSQK